MSLFKYMLYGKRSKKSVPDDSNDDYDYDEDKTITDNDNLSVDPVTSKINIGEIFGPNGIPRHVLAKQGLINDEIDDKEYWWCYKGHKDFDPEKRKLAYDAVTVDQAIEHLNKKIASGDLPVFTIPAQIIEVFHLLERQDFDYMEVSSIIEKNPSLTGMFISSINSSLYNRGFTITELYPALLRLGKNNIRALLQLYSIKISFADDRRFGNMARKIIRHSYIVAIIASYLSQRYFPEPGLAFLAGLLHDIGKLGILKELSLDPRFCLRLKPDVTEDMFDPIFAGRHEQIGVKLGQQWKMDDLTLSAIERHHNFWEYDFSDEDQLDYHLCLLINLSDTMARILGEGRPIGETNIFLEPATIDLNIEKNISTVEFFADIPAIVSNKSANNIL